ncbi:hypothetical protein F2Q69_00047604 [Brassica cretica]|uniref:Uncharacterized protein n=1 Tax=Brassica cretica TaxID=69181 RepID=A0A8S9PVZ0_BRACR|nr:hypothetical protein F2Q69_00047604 [Brassica cretica]
MPPPSPSDHAATLRGPATWRTSAASARGHTPAIPTYADMFTRPEEDYQRVVVDALTAIWARVPARRSQLHLDTLQLAQKFSVSALSIDEEEPNLTSNTKLDTTACLGVLYTWDQIL